MENLKDAKPLENYSALKDEDVKETKEENASLDEGKQVTDEDHENPYHNLQASCQKVLETKVSYPERPGERDCNFYMRTGLCAYGARCRYNHPPKTSFYSDSFPERIGEPDCQYYLKTGTCRFGAMCKYHHPQEIKKIKLNTFGFPLREGERDCSFYLRTRTCKYGTTCRFHHPELPILQIYLQVSASTFNGREEPYSPVLIPTQPLPAGPYWNSHSDAKAYHSKSSNGCVAESNIDTMNTMKHRKSNEQEKIKDSSPESISNAGSDCNLHSIEKSTHSTTLTSTVLPLRPGVAVCLFFKEYGVCQLGPSCNYHHPLEILGELSLSQKCLDSNPNVES